MADPGCALLLLAAGGSRRMGEPKQLLDVGGEPMIRVAARVALSAALHPTVIVLGAHAERIRDLLKGLPLEIVENPQWEDGMASSLRAGLTAVLTKAPRILGLIVMLADQPRLTAGHLRALVSAQRDSGRPVVASDYGDHLGPPAYFGREHFSALLALHGDHGARALLQELDALPVAISADAGADLDTSSDYARLIESPPVSR